MKPLSLVVAVLAACAAPALTLANPPEKTLASQTFDLNINGTQIGAEFGYQLALPGDVDGAPAGPAWPGPTNSLTRHRSTGAVGGAGVAGVADSETASPDLKALTSNTDVSAFVLKAVLRVSSQAMACG